MNFNYLTLGHDCSPAGALRALELRTTAYPFDWNISTISALESCFATNFEYFHKNVVLNDTNTKVVDLYGFIFPHDYPLENVNNMEEYIGEGVFAEENGKRIVNHWMDYNQIVVDKYARRIERFKNIVYDPKPIIVFCRYNTNEVLKLYHLFITYYKRSDVYFINSSSEPFENDNIKNIYTEKNNIWNDPTVWKEGLNDMLHKL